MPLETQARIAAERLLILTEAIADSIVNERLDEVPGLLKSRQAELDRLENLEIDTLAKAILERVAASERDLISLLYRSTGKVSSEMAQLFTGMRQVRAYRNAPQPGSFQRAG